MHAYYVEIKKVWKQGEDGMKLNGRYRIKVNSKAFTIPIQTASAFTMFDRIAVRVGIVKALELTFVL